MSLKINNETITASELSGTNEDLTYFNTSLTPLVPNSNIKLLGSPSQREQLKRMANGNIPYALTYEQKISNIVNPGNNAELYSTITEPHKIIHDFSSNNLFSLANSFNPQNNTWEIVIKFKPKEVSSQGLFGKSFSTWYGMRIDLAGEGRHLYYLISTNSGTSSSDYFEGAGSNDYVLNEWNYVKATFNSSSYKYYYSTNGKNWKLDYEYQSSAPLVQFTANTYIGFNQGTSKYFNGEIDLTETYIKINDEYFFNGATAVQGADYNITGSISITEEIIPVQIPSSFTFSFDLDSSTFTQGTKYLLEHPNLMKVKTEKNDLYFNFPWRNNNWCNIANQKMFYAYTDGNGNTIYTPDENLQGTFKSLNTNDFTDNNNNISIDADGYATFPPTNDGDYIISKEIFDTSAQHWKVHLEFLNLDTSTPYKTLITSYSSYTGVIIDKNQYGHMHTLVGLNNGSYQTVGDFIPEVNKYYSTEAKYDDGVLGFYIEEGQKDNPQLNAQGTIYNSLVGNKLITVCEAAAYSLGSKVFLPRCYFENNGNKITMAIFNTTSNLYNSNFEKITPTTVENYNDVVIVDGTTYTRDTSKDGIKNVPVLVTGTNTISLTAPEALLQIPYYAYTYNNDSVYTKTLSLSTRKNSSVQGSLTIDGSNYSGFSSSNYIQTINFDPQDKPWEIVIKAKFNSSGQVGFCATKSQRAWNTYWNGNGVNVELSSNNGGWDIGSISHTTTFVSDNTTWYWMKFEFTGSQYIYSVKSQNDADYIVQGNPITSSTPIYTNGHPIPLTLGIDIGGSAMPAATIDLSDCYFKIGNEVTNFNSTILLNSLYDSQFQKLTYEQNPEVLNNDIIIDNNAYVRTQANDLTQILETADKIKLVVNDHNFTLTDGDLPAITTGVLGYREELEF